MKPSFRCPSIGGLSLLVAAAAIGCTPSNKVTAGAPEMVAFVAVDPGDAEVTDPVPPLSHFYALFDRLLDATAIEDVNDDGTFAPKNGVATIAWSGGTATAVVSYFPNGDHRFSLLPLAFGIPHALGPSLTVNAPDGLPTASAVTVSFDPNKVRSYDQTLPFVVDPDAGIGAQLTVMTAALAVTTDVPVPVVPEAGTADDAGSSGDAGAAPMPPPPVAPDFVAHVTFNDFTSTATAAAITVTGTVGGAPVAALGATVALDDADATMYDVSPPAAGWPPGAVITITVGANAADRFQQKLGTAVTATFTVTP